MPADVGLVVVVAEALAVALHHLSGGEMAELPWGLQSGRRGGRTALEGPHQVHGGLKILRCPEFDVDADVIRKATHEEVVLLEWGRLWRVAYQGVETLQIFLDGAMPREPCEVRETVAADGWTEALVGELLEAFPRRHALVVLKGLRHPGHVI